MIVAVFRDGGPVDAPILVRRQGVSAHQRYWQVPGRTLTAGPLTCLAVGGAVTRTELKSRLWWAAYIELDGGLHNFVLKRSLRLCSHMSRSLICKRTQVANKI